MASATPAVWPVFVGAMMMALAAADFQDGTSLLQIADATNMSLPQISDVGNASLLQIADARDSEEEEVQSADPPSFDELRREVEQLRAAPRVLLAAVFSDWMYSLDTFPRLGWEGWRIRGRYSHDGDDVALFAKGYDKYRRKYEHCVLAFKGTETLKQWISNAQYGKTRGSQDKKESLTAKKCGLGAHKDDVYDDQDQGVHSGFWQDMKLFMKRSWARAAGNNIRMTEIKQCKQLDVTGHSKGGAMAGIYAACANSNTFKYGWKRVDKLFTFGAPAIAVVAPSNDVEPNRIFEGERMINYDDKRHFDPVTGLLSPKYAHPRMAMLEFTPISVYKAGAALPATWKTPSPSWGYVMARLAPDKSLHSMDLYLERVLGRVKRMR